MDKLKIKNRKNKSKLVRESAEKFPLKTAENDSAVQRLHPKGCKISPKIQKMNELNIVTGLLNNKSVVAHMKLKSGIETFYSSSLLHRKENHVDYFMYPYRKGRHSGFIKMPSLGVKKRSKTLSRLEFIVLMGQLRLLIDDKSIIFECGSLIKIPIGIHYSLINPTSEVTILQFQSTCGEK